MARRSQQICIAGQALANRQMMWEFKFRSLINCLFYFNVKTKTVENYLHFYSYWLGGSIIATDLLLLL